MSFFYLSMICDIFAIILMLYIVLHNKENTDLNESNRNNKEEKYKKMKNQNITIEKIYNFYFDKIINLFKEYTDSLCYSKNDNSVTLNVTKLSSDEEIKISKKIDGHKFNVKLKELIYEIKYSDSGQAKYINAEMTLSSNIVHESFKFEECDFFKIFKIFYLKDYNFDEISEKIKSYYINNYKYKASESFGFNIANLNNSLTLNGESIIYKLKIFANAKNKEELLLSNNINIDTISKNNYIMIKNYNSLIEKAISLFYKYNLDFEKQPVFMSRNIVKKYGNVFNLVYMDNSNYDEGEFKEAKYLLELNDKGDVECITGIVCINVNKDNIMKGEFRFEDSIIIKMAHLINKNLRDYSEINNKINNFYLEHPYKKLQVDYVGRVDREIFYEHNTQEKNDMNQAIIRETWELYCHKLRYTIKVYPPYKDKVNIEEGDFNATFSG